MICPKCGEDNSNNFRFCGMCGTLLEARRPTGHPLDSATPGPIKTANRLEPLAVQNAVQPAYNKPAYKMVPPISGPSMLGLSEPSATQLDSNLAGANQPSLNHPSMDSLREKSFSGFDSFLEPEQPKTGGGRILLLLALLAALGVAGWWTYTNYLGAVQTRKLDTSIGDSEVAAEKPSIEPTGKQATSAPDSGASQAAVPSAGVAENKAENESAGAEPAQKPVTADVKPEVETTPATPAKTAPDEKATARPEPRVQPAKAAKSPEPIAADTGDAAFRKGEAYLYGRGVPENCDEAVKSLKAASAKSSAKARSAFGTMYATGHCVPRDLPTSYSWFALALRVDPNNQILEKDLSAVWNQMTPPERQMATRMKR